VPVLLLDVPHPSVIPAESRDPDEPTLLHALFAHDLQLDLESLRQVPAVDLTRYVYDAAVSRHLIPRDTAFEQVERVLAAYKAHSRIHGSHETMLDPQHSAHLADLVAGYLRS